MYKFQKLYGKKKGLCKYHLIYVPMRSGFGGEAVPAEVLGQKALQEGALWSKVIGACL